MVTNSHLASSHQLSPPLSTCFRQGVYNVPYFPPLHARAACQSSKDRHL